MREIFICFEIKRIRRYPSHEISFQDIGIMGIRHFRALIRMKMFYSRDFDLFERLKSSHKQSVLFYGHPRSRKWTWCNLDPWLAIFIIYSPSIQVKIGSNIFGHHLKMRQLVASDEISAIVIVHKLVHFAFERDFSMFRNHVYSTLFQPTNFSRQTRNHRFSTLSR